MLLTQAARDLHETITNRWAKLRAWLDDGANASAASKVRGTIDKFYSCWQGLDKGLLSDPDDIDGAYLDLEVAETYAIEKGYPRPDGYRQRMTSTVELKPLTAEAQAVEDYFCKDNPDSPVCRATAPQDNVPLCQRFGMPSAICDKDGIKSWFLWSLGLGGAAMFGVAAYAAYKAAQVGVAVAKEAAPYALAAYAPGALPAFQAYQQGDRAKVKEHVVKAVAEHVAANAPTRRVSAAEDSYENCVRRLGSTWCRAHKDAPEDSDAAKTIARPR